mmetsp:Transcript_18815/g.24914  ORF Transcript_18815/g.24914 Transcript_18815/m.24914 type:complete len:443 (+) Transcript_18815:153-1481(+)
MTMQIDNRTSSPPVQVLRRAPSTTETKAATTKIRRWQHKNCNDLKITTTRTQSTTTLVSPKTKNKTKKANPDNKPRSRIERVTAKQNKKENQSTSLSKQKRYRQRQGPLHRTSTPHSLLQSSPKSSSDLNTMKSVRFSDPLITAVYTRPYTPSKLIPILFYSSDDEMKFRREAHTQLQRKKFAMALKKFKQQCNHRDSFSDFGSNCDDYDDIEGDIISLSSTDSSLSSLDDDHNATADYTRERSQEFFVTPSPQSLLKNHTNITTSSSSLSASSSSLSLSSWSQESPPSKKKFGVSHAIVEHNGKTFTYYNHDYDKTETIRSHNDPNASNDARKILTKQQHPSLSSPENNNATGNQVEQHYLSDIPSVATTTISTSKRKRQTFSSSSSSLSASSPFHHVTTMNNDLKKEKEVETTATATKECFEFDNPTFWNGSITWYSKDE